MSVCKGFDGSGAYDDGQGFSLGGGSWAARCVKRSLASFMISV